MNIRVMCEMAAIDFAKIASEKTVIISIVSKSEKAINFEQNENIIDIFRLFINDLCVDYGEHKAPIQEDFDGLKNFIDKYKGLDIVVHCAAGISRSAGVAMAIGEYLNIETGIANSPNYEPNVVCYRCVQYELTGYKPGDGFKTEEK